MREQLRTCRTAEHSAREILPEVRLQLLKDRVESSGIVHPKTRDIDNTNRKDHEKKMRNGMNSEHTPWSGAAAEWRARQRIRRRRAASRGSAWCPHVRALGVGVAPPERAHDRQRRACSTCTADARGALSASTRDTGDNEPRNNEQNIGENVVMTYEDVWKETFMVVAVVKDSRNPCNPETTNINYIGVTYTKEMIWLISI